MKIEVKGFEVYMGADSKANIFTLNIPKLKIFNTYEIKKDPLGTLENKATEIIKQKLNT